MDDKIIYLSQKEHLEVLERGRQLRKKREERQELFYDFDDPETQKQIFEESYKNNEDFRKVVKEYVLKYEDLAGNRRFLNEQDEYIEEYFYKKEVFDMQKLIADEIKEIDRQLLYLNRFALHNRERPPPSYESIYPYYKKDKDDKDDKDDPAAGIGA